MIWTSKAYAFYSKQKTFLYNVSRGHQDHLLVQLFTRLTEWTSNNTNSYDLLQQRDTKQNQHREQTWGEVQGKPGKVSKGLLLVQSHRMGLIPPAMIWDSIYECYQARKLIRDAVPRVFIGGWSQKQVPFDWHILRFQDPRRKANIQHKLCLHSLGLVSYSYEFRE